MTRLNTLLLPLVVLIVACGGADEPASRDGEETQPGQQVVTSSDGAVTLTIPSGATDAAADIEIQLLDPDDVADFASPELVSSVYDLQPSGLEFSEPVTIAIRLPRDAFGTETGVPLLVSVLSTDGELELPEVQEVAVVDDDVVHTSLVTHFSGIALYHNRVFAELSPDAFFGAQGDTFFSFPWTRTIGGAQDDYDFFSDTAQWIRNDPVVSYLGGVRVVDDKPLNHECSGTSTGTYGGTFEVGEAELSPDTDQGKRLLGFFVFMGAPAATEAIVDYRVTMTAPADCSGTTSVTGDGDTPGTTAGAALPPCDAYSSDINVGSIGQVGNAAAETGLIPEGVSARDVGAELRRMMEVTGEVCQADLLDLVENGNLTPELETTIQDAVERIQAEG